MRIPADYHVRVTLITGDARQGRLLGWTDTHMTIHDGLVREIELVQVADVDRVPAPFERCLSAD